jgi:hypothetical protein
MYVVLVSLFIFNLMPPHVQIESETICSCVVLEYTQMFHFIIRGVMCGTEHSSRFKEYVLCVH